MPAAGPVTWPASSMITAVSWPGTSSSAARTRSGSPACSGPRSPPTASPRSCIPITDLASPMPRWPGRARSWASAWSAVSQAARWAGARSSARSRPSSSSSWSRSPPATTRPGHWVREVYHQRVHSETGESPQARHAAAGPAASPDATLLREAFSWSAVRLVRKTATVALEGNEYSVDPFLAGRKVELVFDPFDMTQLTVYWAGRKVGRAVPQVIGRHAHPKAPPGEDPEPVKYTGIDYLGLVAATGQAASGERLHLSNIADGDGTGHDDGTGHQD